MAKHISDTINVGVSDIYWYPQESDIPVHLGLTKGGAVMKYEGDWHEITADQTGTTPLEDVNIGGKVTVEVKVLDTTKNKIALIMPTANGVGSGSDLDAVTFGQRPGLRATHHSGKLVIRPISMGDDRSYDVIIYRTTNTGGLELAFKLDEEWVIPCVFKGYYDDFRKEGDRLFRIGADDGDTAIYRTVILFWITPSNPETTIGGTVQFRANAMYEDGSTEDVTAQCIWACSDVTKASLSGTAVKTATGVALGSVVIRAEYIGYSCTTSLVVV